MGNPKQSLVSFVSISLTATLLFAGCSTEPQSEKDRGSLYHMSQLAAPERDPKAANEGRPELTTKGNTKKTKTVVGDENDLGEDGIVDSDDASGTTEEESINASSAPGGMVVCSTTPSDSS